LLVEVPFAERSGEDGFLEILEALDVESGFDVVFELFIEGAFGVGGPTSEGADVIVEGAGGGEAGIVVVFEFDDFDEAFVDAAAASFGIVFGHDDGFAEVDDALFEFGDDVVVADDAGGLEGEVTVGAFEGLSDEFDDGFFEFGEEDVAAFEDEFFFVGGEAVGLVVESDEGGVSRGIEELFEALQEFGGLDFFGGEDILRFFAEVEFQVEWEEGEGGAVDAAESIDLVVEGVPVGLEDILAVEFADVIEGALDFEGTG
jgi:hypothetical protein